MTTLDRRDMIGSIAALLGAATLPAQAWAAAPSVAPSLDRSTTALVMALADTLIPRTDTPGAVQVGVPGKFDQLLRDWANKDRRDALLGGLAALDASAKARSGRPFAAMSASARKTFLTAYDAAHFKTDNAYTNLKELLISLYYLSEPGATKELRYEHAPGAWVASIPLTAKTRAWAGANVG